MTIRTQSGSAYNFVCKNDKLYVQKGMSEGVVTAISDIEIGKQLVITYRPLNMFCQESSETTTIQTSPVVSIT